jgi:hypothetical protein
MEKSIDRLPRFIGIAADYHTKQEWVHSLISQLRPNTVVVTNVGGMEERIEKSVAFRGDLYFKLFESDEWEEQLSGRTHAARLRDYLFMTYLKFNKGFLFAFPAKYDTVAIGMQYSKRMQDLIILAHQMKVPYEIIATEGEEE